jgi:hypothetical protein
MAILKALTEALHLVGALALYVGNLAQDRIDFPEADLDDDDLKFAQGVLEAVHWLVYDELELGADEAFLRKLNR